MLRAASALVVLALLIAAGAPRSEPARAEKVDMDAAALLSTATHVVVAEVKAIYERTAREGNYRVTRRVAALKVETVEKGDGIALDAPVYVRYWTQEWAGAGTMPPGTGGHRGLPKEGERLRVYLAKNAYDGFSTTNQDGGFNVIGANGFERLAALSGR
jgi:hypothetical protein